MARRRRIEAPGGAAIDRIRAEAAAFAAAPSIFDTTSAPPIAQIAGDSATASTREISALRAEAERYRADTARLRQAEIDGKLIIEVDLDAIDADFLARDRLPRSENDDGWRALKASIQAHGQRMPLELTRLGEGAERPFGLISGRRRLSVLQRLHAETGDPRWSRARAILRAASGLGQAFLMMVEENEVREGLSYFERGRVCVLAAQQGAFLSTDAAIETLFAAASPAKRSKIRSFTRLVEELGDLLAHPYAIGERLGLELARAVKTDRGGALRHALGSRGAVARDAAEETSLLRAFLAEARSAAPPATQPGLFGDDPIVAWRRRRDGFVVRVSAPDCSDSEIEEALAALVRALPQR